LKRENIREKYFCTFKALILSLVIFKTISSNEIPVYKVKKFGIMINIRTMGICSIRPTIRKILATA
jgi:hypothetical protein